MGKHLGFAIPASGLSFVQGSYEEESNIQGARNKRKSMDTSTPKPRKRSKTATSVENLEPMEIQIEAVETSPLPSFTCSLCHKHFSSKYLLKKHGQDCFEITTESQDSTINNEPISEATSVTKSSENVETGKGKCDFCGKFFALSGGWLTKHQKMCQKQNFVNESLTEHEVTNEDHESLAQTTNESANVSTNSERNKKECQNCGKFYPTAGGWITKHLAKCLLQSQPADDLTTSATSNDTPIEIKDTTIEQKETNACPKCGKIYPPHVARHLKHHISKCNGVLGPDSPHPDPIVNVAVVATAQDLNPEPEGKKASIENVEPSIDLAAYIEIYKQSQWSCYMCTKWYGRRDSLRQHLLVHYKKELREKYMTEPESPICSLCGIESKDTKTLLNHISIGTHQKLIDFVPEVLSNYIFAKAMKSETESQNENSIDAASSSDEKETEIDSKFKCYVCQTAFKEKTALTDHIVNHFSEKILDRFVENGTKCKICQYKDANLGQLTRHVAFQHEKVRDYLPKKGQFLFDHMMCVVVILLKVMYKLLLLS